MTDTPHPPGHHDAMQVAEKAGSRAAGQAFFGKCLDATGMENARRHAMCLAYLAAMRPQIAREERQKALREAASMAESARLACLKSSEWVRGAQISGRLRDDILALINAETNDE